MTGIFTEVNKILKKIYLFSFFNFVDYNINYNYSKKEENSLTFDL